MKNFYKNRGIRDYIGFGGRQSKRKTGFLEGGGGFKFTFWFARFKFHPAIVLSYSLLCVVYCSRDYVFIRCYCWNHKPIVIAMCNTVVAWLITFVKQMSNRCYQGFSPFILILFLWDGRPLEGLTTMCKNLHYVYDIVSCLGFLEKTLKNLLSNSKPSHQTDKLSLVLYFSFALYLQCSKQRTKSLMYNI